MSMLRNYLKVALRTLLKNRSYSLINISGLALGITCCAMIILYVQDELAYDRFHEHADQIYRLRVERFSSGGESELTSTAAGPMMPAAISDIPQILDATRLNRRSYLVRYGDRSFYEDEFYYADSSFFRVFSFELLRGEKDDVLSRPYSVVITERTAQKYFGSSDPMGQTLRVDDRDVTVTGVAKNPPTQSHFNFDILASFSTLEAIVERTSDTWNWWDLSYHTYFLLQPGTDIEAVSALVKEMPSRYIGDQESGSGYRQFLYLQPLTSIHLESAYRSELGANGDKKYVYIFTVIALFILLLACINFMNLATARSTQRAREVGMRKVAGARKHQLIAQFLGESVLMSLISVVVAIGLIVLLLPYFNQLAFKTLTFGFVDNWRFILGLLAGGVLVGIGAGVYPAFVLSTFRPASVLKGQFSTGAGAARLRQVLVVFQFTISLVLIIGALVANRQLSFMRTADLGFDKEQILVINVRRNAGIASQTDAFRDALSQLPSTRGVTFSSTTPGRDPFLNVISRQSGFNDDGQTIAQLGVDYDFLKTYGMEIVEGRGFEREMVSDDSAAFVINEAAVRALGWSSSAEAVGEELTRQFNDTRRVIGVVKNFNYESLQNAVSPIVLLIRPEWFAYVSVKLSGDQMQDAVDGIESVWRSFAPAYPMDYFFLDADYDQQYRTEIRISSVLNIFTMLAIVIASLGLYALASFITAQREKEIGVRKVLGASTQTIVFMLSGSFTYLVLIAAVLAVPAAYFSTEAWLAGFEYRISPAWTLFTLAVFGSLCIAWLTVAYQTIRAALTDPAKTLRND
jgi:putative ABC transport system permease protein